MSNDLKSVLKQLNAVNTSSEAARVEAGKAQMYVISLMELLIQKGVMTVEEAHTVAERAEGQANQGIAQGTRRANSN